MKRKASGKKFFSYERTDAKKRRVVVTLVKENGEFFWIRICTYLGENLKYREDYYKNQNFDLFNQIFNKEMENQNQAEVIRNWIAR